MSDESDENSLLESSLLRNNRSDIIQSLQETIEDLSHYKLDYDNMRNRLEISEKRILLIEAQHKYEIDQMNEIIDEITKKNEDLANEVVNIKRESLEAAKKSAGGTSQEAEEWKQKYTDLVKAFSDEGGLKALYLEAQANVEQLSKRVAVAEGNANNSNMELERKAAKLESLESSNKKLATINKELQSQVKELLSSETTLKEMIQKLEVEKNKKTSLLLRARNKSGRESIKKKKKEKENMDLIEEQKKLLVLRDGAVQRFQQAYANECKLRNRYEKQLEKLRKSSSERIDQLNQEVEELKQKHHEVKCEKNVSQQNESSLNAEVDFLREKSKALEQQLKDSNTTKKQNVKLEQANAELKSVIETLQSSITSVEAGALSKDEQLRAVLSKYMDSVPSTYEWNVLITKVDQLLSASQDLNRENTELKSKLKDIKEKKKTIKEEYNSLSAKYDSMAKDLDNIRAINSIKLPALSQLRTDDHGSFAASVAIAAQQHHNMQNFRKIINIKIDIANFRLRSAAENIINMLNGEEVIQKTLRSVVLTVVFAIRFKYYKADLTYDPTNILSFSQPSSRKHIPLEKKLQSTVEQYIENRNELRKDYEHFREVEFEYTTTLEDLKGKVEAADNEIKAKNSMLASCMKNIEELKEEIKNKVDKSELNQAQSELRESRAREEIVKDELTTVKEELNNLLSAVNARERERESSDIELHRMQLENDELQMKLNEVLNELHVTKMSLKEKNRDILSLERMNGKKAATVVIDPVQTAQNINTSSSLSQTSSLQKKHRNVSFTGLPGQSKFTLNQSVREGLIEMQQAILNNQTAKK